MCFRFLQALIDALHRLLYLRYFLLQLGYFLLHAFYFLLEAVHIRTQFSNFLLHTFYFLLEAIHIRTQLGYFLLHAFYFLLEAIHIRTQFDNFLLHGIDLSLYADKTIYCSGSEVVEGRYEILTQGIDRSIKPLTYFRNSLLIFFGLPVYCTEHLAHHCQQFGVIISHIAKRK